MAQGGTGTAGRIRAKNAAMASRMKLLGINRTTQRCPICYRIVSRDNGASARYTHICKG